MRKLIILFTILIFLSIQPMQTYADDIGKNTGISSDKGFTAHKFYLSGAYSGLAAQSLFDRWRNPAWEVFNFYGPYNINLEYSMAKRHSLLVSLGYINKQYIADVGNIYSCYLNYNFHFGKLGSAFDPYIGAGYGISTSVLQNDYHGNFEISPTIQIGARYFITKRFAVFGELRQSEIFLVRSVTQFGLTLKL